MTTEHPPEQQAAEIPQVLRGFLSYHETIRGHSKKTTDEYFLDLRVFFRFMKIHRGLAPRGADFDGVSIADIDLDFIAAITLSEVYEFLTFLSRERPQRQNSAHTEYGIEAKARARKLSALRSLFKYLTVKTHQLDEDPLIGLDSPKIPTSLPRYLSLDESRRLLAAVSGRNRERDYCILTLFLNCGLRISEIVGLDLNDIMPDSLRVLGKGNKERVVFLNEACITSINAYLAVRKSLIPAPRDARAVFLSETSKTREHNRVSRATVNHLVKKHLQSAGLSPTDYSAHKLRHTAATLMLKSGVDVRTLQEILGHDHLNTTQIYTHVEHENLREAALLNPLAEYKVPDPKLE
ncbi:MAG: tyrosine-type recombinase/integrase [Oscillospiraceae bacterium]|jgi:site-specific recombinase XerD|nr:tyrosine-type recombinase/integrase [Oscillospiraceae bacterium]